MLIRFSKLTGKAIDNDYYINPDQIIDYGPNGSDENQTLIYFTDDRKTIVEKSPREVTDILVGCGVRVWR